MKNPDHDTRRTVIREWMALPKGKRRTQDDALSFATAAVEHHTLKGPGESPARILCWLLPRIGRG